MKKRVGLWSLVLGLWGWGFAASAGTPEQEAKPVAGLVAHWRFDEPVQPMVLFEDRMLEGELRSFTDLFKPLEVHIYQWTGQ